MKLRSPSEHAAYNATHYPGTRQLCFLCDAETERCEEDDLYIDTKDDDGYPMCIGPLCLECYSRKTNL